MTKKTQKPHPSYPESLCIIPARGGSKGIPRKNLCDIAGKPLIAWSIECALAAKSVNRVIVSTDDSEIGDVSRHYGAEIVTRPAELADDNASSEAALLHVLDHLKQRENYEPTLVIFLQPTSPYRLVSDIDDAVNHLLKGQFDSVFSAYPEHFTGRWSQASDLSVSPLNFDPDNRPRRQDRGIEFLENGSIYVFKPEIIRTYNSRMGGRIGISEMPPERSYQIDSIEDLAFLEKLMSGTSKSGVTNAHVLRHLNTQTGEQPQLVPIIPSPTMLGRIKLLALDFDGVLTDNHVWVDGEGHETVCCSRSDSWGLTCLKKTGVRVAVISTESSSVVEARCKKLEIPFVSNCGSKDVALAQMAKKLNIDRANVAFVGNDTNDRDALNWAGVSILVGDANPALKSLAVWILHQRGGNGAVREVCDAIIEAKQVPAAAEPEGEGIYFVRRITENPPDYEDDYWGTVRDPDGHVRDRLQEQQKHLEDLSSELSFLNGLLGGKILDVGCGLGYLLSGLECKWECHGVEVSKFAASRAEEWGRIYCGPLEDAEYPSDYFDTVVFHHVIEHLEEPLNVLREIRRVLRPGGRLILGTPDFDSGCARRFGPHYRLLHDQTHVSLFTRESMYRLLRDEGFVVEYVDYPYFSTRYFTKENLLRMLDSDSTSPPFYGNFMTFYVRKPEIGELRQPPLISFPHLSEADQRLETIRKGELNES